MLKWILSVIYLWIKENRIFKVLLNLFRLCFLNCFIYGTTIAFAHNSTKFTFSSKLIIWTLALNIFHKKLLDICHANCSLILLNFAIHETSSSSNCPISNEVCLKFCFWKAFFNILKNVFTVIPPKRFSLQFFVEYFYKNIQNLRIKMFYQNHGHTFVLY